MQREFQVGDKVRIVRCWSGDSDHANKVGVVIGQYADGDYRVDFGGLALCVATTVELIEPAKSHRFKVGDRVRILRKEAMAWSGNPGEDVIGKIGHITKVSLGSLQVMSTSSGGYYGLFDPDELELIEAADKPEGETYSREDAYTEIFRQVMSIQTPPMFGQWITTEPKPSSANGIMGRVKTLARKLLDKDTQSLIEAGVLTNDLSVRDTDFVLSFLVNQYKKELAIEARAKIKAERDEDED